MKLLVLLIFLSIPSYAETITVALFEDHESYLKHSRAYKVNWEVFELAAKSEGFTLEPEPYLWLRAMNELKLAKVDAMVGAFYSKERSKIAYFSQPMALDNIYLYAAKENQLSVNEIKSQNPLIGVTTNSIGDSVATNLEFLNIYRKSSSEQVFDLLTKGRIDYAIFSESVAEKHCASAIEHNLKRNCLFPMALPIKINTFHTIYSKTPRTKDIASRIDASVNRLIYQEKIKPIFLNSGYSTEEYELWLEARNSKLVQ